MTVRELITQLLLCEDMDSDVFLEDSVPFTDEQGNHCDGSVYQIEKVEYCGYTALAFNNRNHFTKRFIKKTEENK